MPHTPPFTQQKERLSSVSLLTDAPSHTHPARSRNRRAIRGPERALNSQINKLWEYELKTDPCKEAVCTFGNKRAHSISFFTRQSVASKS